MGCVLPCRRRPQGKQVTVPKNKAFDGIIRRRLLLFRQKSGPAPRARSAGSLFLCPRQGFSKQPKARPHSFLFSPKPGETPTNAPSHCNPPRIGVEENQAGSRPKVSTQPQRKPRGRERGDSRQPALEQFFQPNAGVPHSLVIAAAKRQSRLELAPQTAVSRKQTPTRLVSSKPRKIRDPSLTKNP